MDDQLRAVFDELQTAITRSEADGVVDAEERAELRGIVDRLDALLAEPDSDEHDGIGEQLQESAIRFEGRHPTVATAIRSAVDTLTNMGM